MKKISFFCWLLIMVTLVSGCSSLTVAVSQYTLSENNFNHYLKKHLDKEQQIDIAGLANISLTFNELDTKFGGNNPHKITLSGNAALKMNSVIGDQYANIKLNISALPYFDNKQGAIFLKDIELNDYLLDSSLGEISNKMVLPYLNTLLQAYFNNQPVYRLETKNNPVEAILAKTTKYISVEDDHISFK